MWSKTVALERNRADKLLWPVRVGIASSCAGSLRVRAAAGRRIQGPQKNARGTQQISTDWPERLPKVRDRVKARKWRPEDPHFNERTRVFVRPLPEEPRVGGFGERVCCTGTRVSLRACFKWTYQQCWAVMKANRGVGGRVECRSEKLGGIVISQRNWERKEQVGQIAEGRCETQAGRVQERGPRM